MSVSQLSTRSGMSAVGTTKRAGIGTVGISSCIQTSWPACSRIRHAKDTGLGRFPSREFAINAAWLGCVILVAWTRLLALHGDATVLASCEPKALRYRLWHVPARLTHGQRRRRLRIPQSWPWATAIVAVFANITAIPEPD